MTDDQNEIQADDGKQVGGQRQTQTYLRNLLDSNGLRPRRQLGQNFLVDLNLLDLLVESSQVQPTDVVLEIGAGTAGLTSRLAARAKHVVSVELDPGFYKLARYELQGQANVDLLHADALHNKNRMNPDVLAAVQNAMAKHGQRDYLLVANLPYDVATSVVGNLLLLTEPQVRSLTFTVQLEVAERIAADPGSKDYGAISVLVQSLATPHWIRRLGPKVFWPRPKIDSAILHVVRRPDPVCSQERLAGFHAFLRDLFSHRRKGTRQALVSIPRFKAVKDAVDGVLATLGPAIAAPGRRAEQLSPTDLYTLYEAVVRLPAGD